MNYQFKWGEMTVNDGLDMVQGLVNEGLFNIATEYSARFEQYAKDNRPWTDRTGHARQSLHSWVDNNLPQSISLYISHGVEYGLDLELRGYGIVEETITHHAPFIRNEMDRFFGQAFGKLPKR